MLNLINSHFHFATFLFKRTADALLTFCGVVQPERSFKMSRRSDLTSSGANNTPLGGRGAGSGLSSMSNSGPSLLQPEYLQHGGGGGGGGLKALPAPSMGDDGQNDAKKMQVRLQCEPL